MFINRRQPLKKRQPRRKGDKRPAKSADDLDAEMEVSFTYSYNIKQKAKSTVITRITPNNPRLTKLNK